MPQKHNFFFSQGHFCMPSDILLACKDMQLRFCKLHNVNQYLYANIWHTFTIMFTYTRIACLLLYFLTLSQYGILTKVLPRKIAKKAKDASLLALLSTLVPTILDITFVHLNLEESSVNFYLVEYLSTEKRPSALKK